MLNGMFYERTYRRDSHFYERNSHSRAGAQLEFVCAAEVRATFTLILRVPHATASLWDENQIYTKGELATLKAGVKVFEM